VTRAVLLTRKEAAATLGVSLSHFERHIQHQLPVVYSGRLRLYRPADLEKWVAANVISPRSIAA
jgi:excisionase family DNA binding protein